MNDRDSAAAVVRDMPAKDLKAGVRRNETRAPWHISQVTWHTVLMRTRGQIFIFHTTSLRAAEYPVAASKRKVQF